MMEIVIPSDKGDKELNLEMNTTTTTLKHIDLSDRAWVVFLQRINTQTWHFSILNMPVYKGIDKATRSLNSVCDGAVKRDGMGFNAGDADIGSRVSRNGIARAGEAKALMWAKCLLKYRGQLAGYGINYPDILFEGE
jgi:hypothetical protein